MKATARTKLIVMIVGISGLSGLGFFLFGFSTEVQYAKYDDGIARAAIIDQLHDDIPFRYFQEKATEYLETAGYQVDLYTTKDITVGFYKKLPSMGYKFIVIRTHSGIAPNNDQGARTLGLFTGEKYEAGKYTFEQVNGQVLKSNVLFQQYYAKFKPGPTELNLFSSMSGEYFSVGSKFVDELMLGKFPGSIMVIGGCNTLENPSLADSLLNRGASQIIGWDNLVNSSHNDRVMLAVLKGLLVDKSEVKDVVESAMQTFGADPEYSAVLKYYPDGGADTRV